MRSKSSTLSSTRSDSSMQSVKRDVTTKQTPISIVTNSAKTPKTSRKAGEKGAEKGEKMITIKCQRLTADETYEEVGAKRVAINLNGPSLAKRQATGQVCFRGVLPDAPER